MRFYDDLDKTIERLSANKHANPECQADRQQMCEWLKQLKNIKKLLSFAESQIQPYDLHDRGIDLYRDGWQDAVDFIRDNL